MRAMKMKKTLFALSAIGALATRRRMVRGAVGPTAPGGGGAGSCDVKRGYCNTKRTLT